MDNLKFYNTLTKKKEIFKPIKKDEVGIYSCGPTVYWYQHIGNLRAYIFADLLKRVLMFKDYKVKHVINVTDVGHLTSDADEGEDKIEKAAKKEGKTAKEITKYYFDLFHKDLKKLNIIEPTIWSWATEHIKEQIDLIKNLEKKGYTYKTSDGIYFDTSKFKGYNKIFGIKRSGIQAGKRVSLGEKKNSTDFALWKFSSKNEKRQQEWNSPWGKGFPGWHIECSAMSMKYLGEHFDIHTGGEDHAQIHHPDEIAQSEAATGKKFVNYWMHVSFLQTDNEKMSKSKGGILTLSELEEKNFNPLALRYLYLLTHYKKPLNFSIKNLEAAENSLERLRNILSGLKKSKQKSNKKNVSLVKEQFKEFIGEDLNTPRAMSYMWEILRDDRLSDLEKYESVIKFDKVFGLNLSKEEKISIPLNVKELAEKRNKARKEKNFKKSDEMRDKINKLGYIIEDTEKGYNLKKK